jgi:hypothetical protein
MAALAFVRLVPAPRWIAFVALPFLVAVPLSALSTVGMRGTRVPWLSGRHVVAALAAVATAMAPAALAAFLTGRLQSLLMSSLVVETIGFTAVVASVGLLAGWLACQFERLADGGASLPYLGRSRWNPRRWGVAGTAGVTLFLAFVTVPAWAFALPWGSVAAGFYAVVAGIVAVLSLVVGLALEVAMARIRRPPRMA